MGAGTIVWSGTATLPISGPGVISSIDVSLGTLGATDCVVISPSYTSVQSVDDGQGAFQFYVVKTGSTGFTIYADRPQLPATIVFDYIVLTIST